MLKHFVTLTALVAMLLPALSHAQSEAGALFLIIPPGSRANAMGAAQTALADDIYALYFNPAGIAKLQKGGAGFFHHEWFGFFPITFVGGVYATKAGSFGFAFNNMNLPESFLGEDLNSYERAFQLTFANQVSSHFAIGGSIKLVKTKFDQISGVPDASASALGIDVGILVQNVFPHWTIHRRNESFPAQWRKFDRPPAARFQGLSFGLALLNAGPDRLEYLDETQRDPLPQIFRLGVAYNAVDTDEIGVLLAVDLDKELVERDESGLPDGFVKSWFTSWGDGFDGFHFGAEFNVYHIFAFRFGRDEELNFNSGFGDDSVSEWTFGFGIGPEWARLNLVHRGFPISTLNDKWVVDLVVSY